MIISSGYHISAITMAMSGILGEDVWSNTAHNSWQRRHTVAEANIESTNRIKIYRWGRISFLCIRVSETKLLKFVCFYLIISCNSGVCLMVINSISILKFLWILCYCFHPYQPALITNTDNSLVISTHAGVEHMSMLAVSWLSAVVCVICSSETFNRREVTQSV